MGSERAGQHLGHRGDAVRHEDQAGGPAVLVDELAAAPARGHRLLVAVNSDDRDERAAAGADEV